jgi:hypothetical protein
METGIKTILRVFSERICIPYRAIIQWNNTMRFNKTATAKLSAVYLAPDIIPQGKIDTRFSIDLGFRKTIQKGMGAFFINATDVVNTLVIKKEITGENFRYTSDDYYETQVIRFGYSYKFQQQIQN